MLAPLLEFTCTSSAPFFGFMGVASALVFASEIPLFYFFPKEIVFGFLFVSVGKLAN